MNDGSKISYGTKFYFENTERGVIYNASFQIKS